MSGAYSETFKRAHSLLKECRPIAFAFRFARITEHPKDAVLLSQLVYWTRRGRDIEANLGWMHKTREAWFAETALSREEQENARRRLRARELIDEHRGGRPAKLFFRLNAQTLSTELDKVNPGRVPVQLSFDFMRHHDAVMRAMFGPTTAYYRVLAHVTGSVNAALLLSRMIQLQRYALDAGQQWFTRTARDWQRDLGLNRRQLENARERLRKLGVINEMLLHQRYKRLYIQIDPHALLDHLEPVVQQYKVTDECDTQVDASDAGRAASSPWLRSRAMRSDVPPDVHPEPGLLDVAAASERKSPTVTSGTLPSLPLVGEKRAWQSAGFVHCSGGLSDAANARTYTTTDTITPTTTAPSHVNDQTAAKTAKTAKVRKRAKVGEELQTATPSLGDSSAPAVQMLNSTRGAADRPRGEPSSHEAEASAHLCERCGAAVRMPMSAGPTSASERRGEASKRVVRPAVFAAPAAGPRPEGDFESDAVSSNGTLLIWPSFLAGPERDGIEQHLAPIPVADRQLLIDEMAACHRERPVRYPVAYMGTLATRYLSGRFIAAKAHRERTRRKLAAATQACLLEQEARFEDQIAVREELDSAISEHAGAPDRTCRTSSQEGRVSSPETARAALAALLEGLRRQWQPTQDTQFSARSQGSSRPVYTPRAVSMRNPPSHGPGGPDGYFASPEIP